jgi:hypothetical protein
MIVLSIPKRPDASPETKTVATSAHSSAVTQTYFSPPDLILSRSSDAGLTVKSRDRGGWSRKMTGLIAAANASGTTCARRLLNLRSGSLLSAKRP